MRVPFHNRLNCTSSYAEDDDVHLKCDYGGACDGELYECCVLENPVLGIIAQMAMDEEKLYIDDDSEGVLISEE